MACRANIAPAGRLLPVSRVMRDALCALALAITPILALPGSALATTQAEQTRASTKQGFKYFRASSTLSLRGQQCVGEAANYHNINPDVLHAILLVESNGKPLSVRRNTNGTIDVGLGQINSIHFKELSRYGIQPGHLLDECIATFVAGWHYARQVRRLGNTWQAIGAYHSRTPHLNESYQRRVLRRLVQIGALAAPPKTADSTLVAQQDAQGASR